MTIVLYLIVVLVNFDNILTVGLSNKIVTTGQLQPKTVTFSKIDNVTHKSILSETRRPIYCSSLLEETTLSCSSFLSLFFLSSTHSCS